MGWRGSGVGRRWSSGCGAWPRAAAGKLDNALQSPTCWHCPTLLLPRAKYQCCTGRPPAGLTRHRPHAGVVVVAGVGRGTRNDQLGPAGGRAGSRMGGGRMGGRIGGSRCRGLLCQGPAHCIRGLRPPGSPLSQPPIQPLQPTILSIPPLQPPSLSSPPPPASKLPPLLHPTPPEQRGCLLHHVVVDDAGGLVQAVRHGLHRQYRRYTQVDQQAARGAAPPLQAMLAAPGAAPNNTLPPQRRGRQCRGLVAAVWGLPCPAVPPAVLPAVPSAVPHLEEDGGGGDLLGVCLVAVGQVAACSRGGGRQQHGRG